MPCLTTPRAIFNDLVTFLTDAYRTHLLIHTQRATLVPDSSWLATLGADQHCVRDMQRHRLLDDAPLPGLTLRANVFLRDVEALYDDFVHLGQCSRHCSLLPS